MSRSPTHNKTHAITLVAVAAIAANRFVAAEGKHAGDFTGDAASSAASFSMGVAETAAATGEAVSVVTDYSYLVEAGGAIALHDWVKPHADASGRAAVGGNTEHCGIAMSAATAAGQLIEVRLLPHLKAA